VRYRIKFEKRGSVRFTSHRDVVRIVQRSIAAAGIPVAYSQGYHPHMRMSFGPPLKTGWDGFDEYMDVHLEEPVASLPDLCNAFLPEGLHVLACSGVADGVPKLANDICAASYHVRVRREDLEAGGESGATALARINEQVKARFDGSDDTAGDVPRVIDVSAQTDGDDLSIEYTSTMHSGRVVVPLELAAEYGGTGELATPLRVARSAQFVMRSGEYLSPLDQAVLQGTQ